MLILTGALNASSTAEAATRCLLFEPGTGPAQAIVVARPGVPLRSAIERASERGQGAVVVTPARRPCSTTFRVAGGRLWVSGWDGSIHSSTTRFDGLVAASDVADAVRGSDVLRPGGDADVEALARRLDRVHDERLRIRIVLAAIALVLALAAPRRALMVGPAAVTAALLLSALGWTSLVLFAAATLLGTLAPRRALWVFFAGYLVVLTAWPETASLAVFGPHPEGAGRFYGLTNEVETLLLAPALLLGLAAAPLVILLVAWSRAGADGGGALVYLSSYAWLGLATRARDTVSRAVIAGVAVVAVALALVAIDAATGGSNHVTHTVGDGPGAVWDAFTHRWSTSWHGATGTPGRAALNVGLVAGLVWIATRRPRVILLDAFLVGIAVSLVVNDTPQDVLLWGSIQALALRRAR